MSLAYRGFFFDIIHSQRISGLVTESRLKILFFYINNIAHEKVIISMAANPISRPSINPSV